MDRRRAPPLLRVEHIGSTSVPDLIAKPLPDLMPLLKRFEDGFDGVAPLRALGCWYAGDLGIPGRHLFVRGAPRTHANCLVEAVRGGPRHLALRDVLRSNPQWRARYAALKRRLAARFGDDREGYALARSDFMRELFAYAGVDGEGPEAGRTEQSSA